MCEQPIHWLWRLVKLVASTAPRRCRSDPDEMDFDQRPLAEALVDGSAQRATNRVAHHVVVTPRPGGELLDSTLGSIAQEGRGRGRRSLFDHTDQTDRGGCGEPALTVDDQGSDRAAVQDNARRSFSAAPPSGKRPLPSLAN